jgi:hypothetical protein
MRVRGNHRCPSMSGYARLDVHQTPGRRLAGEEESTKGENENSPIPEGKAHAKIFVASTEKGCPCDTA